MPEYTLQIKALPGEEAALPIAPGAAAPGEDAAVAEEAIEQHEWAGDLYEEGDESDPTEAFGSLTGQAGETAWLDRADDGTLTGWVRDADGSVYRYSDVDAWALDVDQAGMMRTDQAAQVDEQIADLADDAEAEADGDDDALDAALDEEPVDDEEPTDDALVDEGDPLDEEPSEEDAVEEEPTDDLPDGAVPLETDDEGNELDDEANPFDPDETDEDPADEEEDEEEKRRRLGTFATIEGKSFPAAGGGRFVVHPRQ